MLNAVRQFNKQMDVGRHTKMFNKVLYMKLIEEEVSEWIEEAYAADDKKAPEKELKELCDVMYVILGYADTQGWDIVTAFNRVHESNMSKLDAQGKPVYDADNAKVLKGPFYIRPDLSDLVGNETLDKGQ